MAETDGRACNDREQIVVCKGAMVEFVRAAMQVNETCASLGKFTSYGINVGMDGRKNCIARIAQAAIE